jgi:hypothetical protein
VSAARRLPAPIAAAVVALAGVAIASAQRTGRPNALAVTAPAGASPIAAVAQSSEPGGRGYVGGPAGRAAYFSFLVDRVDHALTRVTLRVWALSQSDRAGVDLRAAGWRGPVPFAGGQAAAHSPVVAHHARFRTGWIGFDVTRFVRRPGIYAFALTSTGRRALAFRLGDASGSPSLVFQPGADVLLRSSTRPPGSPPLTGQQSAALVRSAPENRPDNVQANGTSPSAAELAEFHAASHEAYSGEVTGRFSGTTDEIIQWAAWKWGIDEDLMRAVAVQESDWHQPGVSDDGVSFGLYSVKTQLAGDNGWGGTYPLAARSTAFNADFYGRALRACFDGRDSWLRNGYRSGDMWGCVGVWYSGDWHSASADEYVQRVKAWLARRPWARPGY